MPKKRSARTKGSSGTAERPQGAARGGDRRPHAALLELTEELEQRIAQRTAELTQREREFRTLADHVPALYAYVDRDQRYRYVNRRYEDVFQEAADDVVGKTVEQVLGAEAYGIARPHLEAALAGEEVCLEAEMPLGNTGVRWVRMTCVPDYASAGDISGFFTLILDITERKCAEYELRAILDAAADAIITIDQQGIMQSANRATEELFGYTLDELIGQNVRMLMPTPYCDEHDGYIARYLATREPHMIGIGRDVVGRHKKGSTFPIDLAVSEVAHLGLFTGIVRDISERRELQRQVLEIAAEEDRRIGHELHDNIQQQLTGLGLLASSLAEVLSEESSPHAAMAARLATEIQASTNHVHWLSRGLIPVEVDAEGLRSSLAELATRIAEQCRVDCRLQCEGSVKVSDNFVATHLFRIAQEAVNNAIKHGRAKRIEIRLAMSDESISLHVLDNGIGISDRRASGPGMGWRIMNYRAGLIGGTIQVAPGENGGTIVSCTVLQR